MARKVEITSDKLLCSIKGHEFSSPLKEGILVKKTLIFHEH
jgi:hypothetical protein